MPESLWMPETVYVDTCVADHAQTRAVLARLSGVPVHTVENARSAADALMQKPNGFSLGKRALLLTRQKGKFLSTCPAFTESAVCCTYRTINVLLGCNFDCSYCFLQAYLNNPVTTLYVNTEDVFAELRVLISATSRKSFRFGTGEFTDSLSLDHIVGLNEPLIRFFSEYPNATLELKTKSARVDTLLGLPHRGRTIIAWSINTEYIQRAEEHKTASIDERIAAARRCADAGYRVGFHFDPLIIHPEWETGYRKTVEKLKEVIPERAIAWISYGALRYVPRLKQEAKARFPNTPIFSGEFIKGFDNKMRYFTPLRAKLYQTVHGFIREAFPGIQPYMCMEPEHLWEKTFGPANYSTEKLTRTLDVAAAVR